MTESEDKSALLVEPAPTKSSDEARVAREIGASLADTEARVTQLAGQQSDLVLKGWSNARALVERFRPVPWFVWRISNYVLGKTGQTGVVPEGMVLGLRRLLFAAAGDPILGSGQPVNNVKVALSILRSDLIASVSVVHAICRRLASYTELERVWRPILDDAVLRAQIGLFIGERCEDFGRGRGILAGFSGRIGLAVAIATGTSDQARIALEKLSVGEDVAQVGLELYGCDPLQVSAMMLSAAGCGRDAAFGIANFSAKDSLANVENAEARKWLAVFSVIEGIRTNQVEQVDEEFWAAVGLAAPEERAEISDMARLLIREGSSWTWLM